MPRYFAEITTLIGKWSYETLRVGESILAFSTYFKAYDLEGLTVSLLALIQLISYSFHDLAPAQAWRQREHLQ